MNIKSFSPIAAAISCVLMLNGAVVSQTTVFNDDFSTDASVVYTTSGTIGASSFSVTRSGADFGARRNTSPAQLELTNDASGAANVNGWVFAAASTASFTSPYNPTLNLNPGLVTWTFNLRQIRTDPAGFTAGSYGAAFVLGSTSTNVVNSGSGYAVVLGNSGSTDPVRLVKFTNGLQPLGTTIPPTANDIIVSNTTGLTDFGAEYLSVKITYNPSNNQWELFLRNDGATAFNDPSTGTLVSQGTATDSTYTGTALTALGGYWQGATAAAQTAFFDNLRVTVEQPTVIPNLSLDDVSLNEGNSGTSVFQFTVSLSAPAPAGGATFDIATADGAATTADGDYVAQSLTSQTIPEGSSSYTFDVTVNGDTTVEPNETFLVNVTNVTGASVSDGQGQGTIVNDDGIDSVAPAIAYAPIPGNPGSTSLTATVTDAVGATSVNIFWSINGGSFSSAPCSSASGTPQDGTWDCIITGAANPSAVAYYVTATDAAMNAAANPSGGASAPNLFTIGSAAIPAGTYTDLSLGQGVSLGGTVVVNSSLNLNGVIDTGANILTLECAAAITGGGEFGYVIGNLEKRFCGAGTFTYPVGAAFALPPVAGENSLLAPEGIASNYSPLTVQITAGTPGSSLTVSATDAFMTAAVQTNSISRFWTLTENGALTAHLTFTYRNEDVVGNETQYNVLRRAGGMTSSYPGGTVNGATNTFSAPNVSDFSQWSAGVAVPTAAGAEIGGRLVTASGEGIRNATVMLSGGNLTHPVYVRTGSFGYYRFTDLAVGQIYVVTVDSKRYTFAEPSRVINLTDSVRDENFVADPR